MESTTWGCVESFECWKITVCCAEDRPFICAKSGCRGITCLLTWLFVSKCCNGGGRKLSTDCSIGCNNSKLGWSRVEALLSWDCNGWITFLNDRSTRWNLEFWGCCGAVGRAGRLGHSTAWGESVTDPYGASVHALLLVIRTESQDTLKTKNGYPEQKNSQVNWKKLSTS